MIRFRSDTTLQVVTEFDEETDNIVDEVEEHFKAGEKAEADIFSEDGEYADLQFGDGSVAVGVNKDCFEVI